MDNGRWVGNYPCPECNSTDNLSVYLKESEDGDYYDGTCHTPGCKSFWGNDELIERGVITGDFKVDKTKLAAPRERITREEVKELYTRTSFDSKMRDGSLYRHLPEWVMEFYGHRVERDVTGEIKAEYYPETQGGKLHGYKSRHMPKKFGWGNLGQTGLRSDLSGQHKFLNGGKWVVLVGGEIDKASAQVMFRNYQLKKGQEDYDHYAVVSPTTGEGSCAKQVAAQYEWLDSFENIVVCMDNDDAGKAAAEEVVKVLPADKVRVMKLSGKDPNDMLAQGREKQFISNFWEASEVVKSGIFSSVDAFSEVRDFLLTPKIPFPPMLEKMNEATRGGIKSTGAIVSIIADTSIGKTLFSDALAIWWAYNSPLIPTTLSIERGRPEYMIDITSQHLGKNLAWFKEGQDAVDYLDDPEVQKLTEDLLINSYGEPRFHVIDDLKTVDILKRQVDRAWKQLGSRLFILDPLTDVLQSLPREEQEDFFLWEKQMKKEGLVFVNILHTRKPPTDKDGKTRPVTEYDAKGTGSSVQSADISIVLNRDKMAVDPVIRNTTEVSLPKARGGITGHVVDLYYDAETRRQYDKELFFKETHDNIGTTESLNCCEEPLF